MYRISYLILILVVALLTSSCGGGSSSSGSSFEQGKNNQWLINSKNGGLAENSKKSISVFFDKGTFSYNTIIKLEDTAVSKSPDNSLQQIGGCRLSYIAATKEASTTYPKQLTKSATITIKLNPARNPNEKIKVYWANELKPNDIENYTDMQIAIDGQTASCSVDHFGYYHMFATPKSPGDKPYEYIGPVQNLAAKTSSKAIKLTWKAPTSGEIAGYKILWVKSLSESVVLTPSIITQTTYTETKALESLQQGLKITYRIIAISKNGVTGYPAEINIKLSNLPSTLSLFRDEMLFPFVFGEVNSYAFQKVSQKWIFVQKGSSSLTVFKADMVLDKVIAPSSTLVIQEPKIIRVLNDDRVVCYDTKANAILLIDKDLKTTSTIISSTILSKPIMGSIKDIYCDSLNHIWVLFTGSTDSAIRIYDTTGTQLKGFGAPGTKNEEINSPISLCSRSTGGVYILDKISDSKWSLKIFNQLGDFIGNLQMIDNSLAPKLNKIPNLNNPTSIAEFSDGRVLIADTGNKRIIVLGSDSILRFVYWFEDKNTKALDPESADKYQVYKFQGGPSNLVVEPLWNNLIATDNGYGFVSMLKRTDE